MARRPLLRAGRALCLALCAAWAANPASAADAVPASAVHVASGAVHATAASSPAAASSVTHASAASAVSGSTASAAAASAASSATPSAASAASAATGASEPKVLALPEHPALTPEQAAEETHSALEMRAVFAREVTRRLHVPPADQRAYGERLQAALEAENLGELAGEYVILVDRDANVQALFIYFRALPQQPWQMIGASPVATGRPGEFDHFFTPLGVFEHTPDNMDFRAEGTMNENGIRGYGKRDMRIYDLGWVNGERGWGKGGYSQMRFQMHATDPDRLEPLLGIRHSKGCVRIPASLNAFIDHNGIIDAEYEALVASGKSLWVLKSDRQATPWAGRFIVVIDSERKTRPAWSPAPGSKARAKVPAGGDQAD
ncbi:L,D-transpeptidase [Paraburkholderia sp. J12]|uniref:L,D-transpeptidase n=1 Tax=Paraburkholderia sp. J12 TaxID=2805432 RepID=UPI002ABE73CB|nr:L,D-transpeptidase [Paraburkholderia sp. J12]